MWWGRWDWAASADFLIAEGAACANEHFHLLVNNNGTSSVLCKHLVSVVCQVHEDAHLPTQMIRDRAVTSLRNFCWVDDQFIQTTVSSLCTSRVSWSHANNCHIVCASSWVQEMMCSFSITECMGGSESASVSWVQVWHCLSLNEYLFIQWWSVSFLFGTYCWRAYKFGSILAKEVAPVLLYSGKDGSDDIRTFRVDSSEAWDRSNVNRTLRTSDKRLAIVCLSFALQVVVW